MGDIQITSHSRKVGSEIDKAFKRALTIIGMKAESYAKALTPVDTGLLRNSVTFALGGAQPGVQQYASNTGDATGTYEGQAPADQDGQMSVYIGTNVHYAPYVELGHNTRAGNFVQPKAFLRPAVEGHTDEFKDVIESELSKI